ncbi:hypothetical protein EMIHUDRAFT_238510 [Emiliania huxleyi CCMP1516]|uniref:Uncharacterized protein n=2 Tax=Emiliania huxleyi TaxID=2903 RepID=A0A0D3JLS7_EMIH1|nr:hypothetical protein EMIHUDRAFT_238510 [Emiliania huxleyi CCMP1516]EOD24462.1 hypothetical protein EMIHUDRAFT_238510 [Emiliania huxleyi CCMP1516]|eukprot:XP_005776891.1 hypothetical protein EMIHUDRAFT_238510 [Emiliania huxleyi CCMP1516]
MSRGGMSCNGATSVGKASNGRTMTGGMTSGAATTTLGAVVASSDGTLSHGPMSDGTTSHCAASNGRTMTGGMTSGAATTTLGAVVASSDGTLSHTCPLSDGTLSHTCPLSDGATSHGEASNGRIMAGGMTSGAATTIGAEASASAIGTIGAMTGANTVRGSLSTAVAGWDRRDQVDPRKLTTLISQAGSADALLALFAAHSTSLNHIHAANLWNKLGKQRVERRHEERLEQLTPKNDDMHMRWWGAGGCAPNFYMGALGHAANSVQLNLGHQAMQRRRMYTGWP